MIDIALRNVLLANATINGYTTSVYPLRLPQGTTGTRIVYTIIDGIPDVQVGSISLIKDASIQLDIYADTYSVCRNLTTELITILNGFEGDFDTLTVSGIYLRNIRNTYEDKLNLYRSTIDIDIHTN